ncbi:MAG: SufE family protein [Candidatus Neomarinimicrobiota bacterium]|nr:MAG: SufE family protein [Candidatus Neomarinimicrobiota bacterium]
MSALDQLTFDDLVANFDWLDSWEDRYRYLLDLGKKLRPYPEELRDEKHKISGCQSQVWMEITWEGDPPVLSFLADSDAHLVRGILAVLTVLLSGRTAAEVAGLDIRRDLDRLDLTDHLSPTRNNGLHSMIATIQASARRLTAS